MTSLARLAIMTACERNVYFLAKWRTASEKKLTIFGDKSPCEHNDVSLESKCHHTEMNA